MNKKKSVVCTILFAIVVCGAMFGAVFVKNASGFSLYHVATSCISGIWIGERIRKFYYWLMKEN